MHCAYTVYVHATCVALVLLLPTVHLWLWPTKFLLKLICDEWLLAILALNVCVDSFQLALGQGYHMFGGLS